MPDDPIVIREVRPEDFAAVADMIVEAYHTVDDPEPDHDVALRDVAGRVGCCLVLVAEADGQLVGTVTYVRPGGELAEIDDDHAATIRMLGVAPIARGSGIGESLVRRCLAAARGDGAARIRLHTQTTMHGAQRLYERLGFARTPEHDWSPGPGVDLLAYALELA